MANRNQGKDAKRPPSKLAQVETLSTALLRETMRLLNRENVFPKRGRWQFAYKIADLVNDYHSEIAFANGIEVKDHGLFVDRYDAQSRAVAYLHALNVKMTAAQLCCDAPLDAFSHWADLWAQAWTITIAWRGSDRRRYEKQFGSLTADGLGKASVSSLPGAGVSRSPNPSNANNVRNVDTSGALNNNNANNTNGVVADREDDASSSKAEMPESCALSQGDAFPCPFLGPKMGRLYREGSGASRVGPEMALPESGRANG